MSSDEPERRVAEALRASASGVGGRGTAGPASRATPRDSAVILTALLIALLGGAVLGTVLALLSLLVPGLLPALG